ncbi:Nn.00g040570.m01.CDS01 [Neocucurbitaria sp. VM-36]
MAHPAADPKVAPLADDLRGFALALPTSVFPKNFFCALCSQLAVDSWKLLCCNKVICSSCQVKLQFPTACPSCDHSPLEADSCTPNKALRNTMRVWLEKRKKKEEAKAAAQAATPPGDGTPAARDVQPVGHVVDKSAESVDEVSKVEHVPFEPGSVTADNAGHVAERAGSASAQPNEETTPPQVDLERRGSSALQHDDKSIEPMATISPTGENAATGAPGGIMGNQSTMNGMQDQMGFGFPNQGGFSNGMGWNGMTQMNGMSTNMMANGNWNGMSPMDFNTMNGIPPSMYGNFGGNMGLGMNDMSAMNMMNYGGGYGNGWNDMGGGYGNFNGHNQMGGYNQSGAYPEMMNQFPKNNFSNQNQNRFHANQGGAYPQRTNRNGSHGGFGPGFQNANSRPESRSGLPHNREDQSPEGPADATPDIKTEGEQIKVSTESTEEGNDILDGASTSFAPSAAQKSSTAKTSETVEETTNQTGDEIKESTQGGGGLNQIQTVDSGDADMENYTQSTMGNGMQPNMPYPQGMMNQFANHPMNASFDSSMNMSMGYDQNHNFGPRGSFNNGAYGAARVLTGQPTEPVGVGVVGAPTGPRAMREGRPNTGFSSRVNSGRYNPPTKSITPAQDAVPSSPQRRVRSRSPQRDESLRVKQRSPTRSRSRSISRGRDGNKDEQRERSRSADLGSRQDGRGRSPTPQSEDEYERRKERRHHRSSRYDDRDEDYDGRHRDDKVSRGDRTRSASADSKYRSSRRDKEKHRSSRSHRDRSKEHRRRHRSRSRVEDKYEDEEAYTNGEKDSDGSSRRKHRSGDKDKYRERGRDRSRDKDRERDRKDRKERDREFEYERSREKDKDRKRRRDREAEDDERDYEDDGHRSSRRSRKERDRERERDRDYDDRERKEKVRQPDKEEDIVGQMMKKRPVSPPLNAPTGPSANGFSIKGRSKNAIMMPPIQPPTGPRALQPPKGPAADRNKDRSDSQDHRRKSSASSVPGGPSTPATLAVQDHYAAERERNARERDSREKVEKSNRDVLTKSIHTRMHSSSRPSLSSKRSRDDMEDAERSEGPRSDIPRGPKADVKAPTGPASHRDKRRKSGATGDDNIANLFTAGLRKNAKARRGGIRTEGDVEREMERVERERERR